MVPASILRRTFKIKYGNEAGTCFSIDVEGRQYLVTAKHVVKGIQHVDEVEILQENTWKTLNTSIAWIPSDQRDIAVLNPAVAFCPPIPLETTKAYMLGQDCLFLGFPFGLHFDAGDLNLQFPIPLVRKGVIAMMADKGNPMLLDGYNNRGFSGGPVVVRSNNRTEVIGVISGYQACSEPIKCHGAQTNLTYDANTGLVIAYHLGEAVDRLKQNPTGAVIPRSATA